MEQGTSLTPSDPRSPVERALLRFRVLAALCIVAGGALAGAGPRAAGWFVIAVGAIGSAVGWVAAERLRRDRERRRG